MPYTKYKDQDIYYEVHGQGEPLVILNGIMMSHVSWVRFVPELSAHNQLILLDFFDQGRSAKMSSFYEQDLQVEVVKTVIDTLGLEKVNLFGISYGGEVALAFAIRYQEYVHRLMLFNTTGYTNPWLRDIGEGWVDVAYTNNPKAFYNITIPIIYSPAFYTQNIQWMDERKKVLYQVFDEAFLQATIRLIRSAEKYDVRESLKAVKADTLIVSGELDYLTPIVEQQLLHQGIKGSHYIMIEGCGHASMYEKPILFTNIIKDFLANGRN